MIIIADAGSSKIDWAVLDTETSHYQSEGWNPTQHQKALVINNKDLKTHLLNCTELHYYSTGAGTSLGIDRAIKELKKYCPAAQINVHGDLLGAARALFKDTEGIAIIIGTGSNVCYYDGQEIKFKTPSLGYLLSDEGSGFAMGKDILKAFFYNKMPADTSQLFLDKYAITKTKLFEIIYSSPRPNASIAAYASFLKSVDNEWKRKLIYKNFEILIQEKILPHKNFLSVPIGFVGSIAKAYHDILEEVCSSYDIKNIKIIARPLDALITYHHE